MHFRVQWQVERTDFLCDPLQCQRHLHGADANDLDVVDNLVSCLACLTCKDAGKSSYSALSFKAWSACFAAWWEDLNLRKEDVSLPLV